MKIQMRLNKKKNEQDHKLIDGQNSKKSQKSNLNNKEKKR